VPPRRERSRTGDPRRAGCGALTTDLVVADALARPTAGGGQKQSRATPGLWALKNA